MNWTRPKPCPEDYYQSIPIRSMALTAWLWCMKPGGTEKKAAKYYRKAADFARSNPGFAKNSIDWFLSEAKRMESDQ